VTLSLSAADTDNDVLTYSWDLGDGTTGSGDAPPASHVYADNGDYTIMLAVADGRGGVDTTRTTAAISNVAPTLSAFAVPTTPVALASGGATISVAATFTDPGSDTHVVALDCGAGASTEAPAPNGTAGGQCTFASPGVYAIQLTVVDDDGASDAEVASGQVVVYDAAAGSITGGGWINSPLGAYTPSPSVTGKLTFGFVAKYQSSSVSIPSGNAEFKLNLAKLDFRSTTLDWLVVGGTIARLQGSGTLNGVGDYGFSIIASDGVADAIRIRIWNRVTGAVVYDNLPGLPGESDDVTTLGGGSIQLHSK
jgi:PKD repeat protein